MRHLNLIFQGGGVKGIAYAGALQPLKEQDFKIHGIGGTSAGALVAALLAIGKRGDKLRDLLEDRDLFELLSKEEAARYERLKAMWARRSEWESAIADLPAIWNLWNSDKRFKGLRTGSSLKKFQAQHSKLLKDLPGLLNDVSACWSAKGLHSSAELRSWLDGVFKDATFNSVKESGFDLRIVAADVGHRRYLVYNQTDHGGTPIARAVHASVSIPLFFSPLEATDGECLVDGGVLSNFPSFLFDKSPYPTVGFRLLDTPGDSASTNTQLGYLWALLETMATAHDKLRERLQSFKSYDIKTPDNIQFDSFDLKPSDAEALFNAGQVVGLKVHWKDDDHSSEKELVKYFDPYPHKVLAAALPQAQALIEEHLNEASWVKEIDQTVNITVRIDHDWTSHYERRDEITVKGSGVLLLQRIRVLVQPEVGRSLSLSETKPLCEEEARGKRKELIYIPAFNADDKKGFVLFFSPPIGEGQGPRVFYQNLTIKKEFDKSLGRDTPDKVVFSVVRRAKTHNLSATLEILVPFNLARLDFHPPSTAAVKKVDGVEYLAYSWEFPKAEIDGKSRDGEVEVRLAGKTPSFVAGADS